MVKPSEEAFANLPEKSAGVLHHGYLGGRKHVEIVLAGRLAPGRRSRETWPMRSRPLGQPLTGNTNWVGSVEFSPDGRTLASGNDDATVRLWDLSSVAELRADPVRVACSLSRTGLTRDAWERRYVPGFSYHDTCA